MPDNCALCDLLTNGALKATKVYQDIFTWLVRWMNYRFLWFTRVARDKPYINFSFWYWKRRGPNKNSLWFVWISKKVIFRKAGCTYTKPSWGAAEFKKIWHKTTLWNSQLKANLMFQNWNCRRSSVQWTSRWNLQNENGVLANVCVTWRKKSSYLSCLWNVKNCNWKCSSFDILTAA